MLPSILSGRTNSMHEAEVSWILHLKGFDFARDCTVNIVDSFKEWLCVALAAVAHDCEHQAIVIYSEVCLSFFLRSTVSDVSYSVRMANLKSDAVNPTYKFEEAGTQKCRKLTTYCKQKPNNRRVSNNRRFGNLSSEEEIIGFFGHRKIHCRVLVMSDGVLVLPWVTFRSDKDFRKLLGISRYGSRNRVAKQRHTYVNAVPSA